MSYLFWLGRESCEIELRHANHQESRDYMQSIFEAYGYEEPQAGTEKHNLTDSISEILSGAPASVDERDFPIILHSWPKL